MKRRRVPSDNRPRWDDPDLTVRLNIAQKGYRPRDFTAEELTRVCARRLANTNEVYSWEWDMSYRWAKRRRKHVK
jgi:hypothetical protein